MDFDNSTKLGPVIYVANLQVSFQRGGTVICDHHFPLFKIFNFFQCLSGSSSTHIHLSFILSCFLNNHQCQPQQPLYILLTESRVKSSEIREEDVSFSWSRSWSLHPRGDPQFIKVEPSPLCPPSSGAKAHLSHGNIWQHTAVFLLLYPYFWLVSQNIVAIVGIVCLAPLPPCPHPHYVLSIAATQPPATILLLPTGCSAQWPCLLLESIRVSIIWL